LRERTRRFFAETWAPKIFPEMRALVDALAARGAAVHVASASNRWIVEAGAAAFGIPAERVMAMRTVVDGGVLTRDIIPPAVTREGKARLLRERFAAPPALVAGNSTNDLPMLRLATKVALVVNGEPGVDPKTGDDLVTEARERGWIAREVRV
jgi:phosphoserine phosphatase